MARAIARETYLQFARKYGISITNKQGKEKTMKQMAREIYNYETKNLPRGAKGLYYY